MRHLIRLLAVLGMQSFCNICGAGPFGESEMAGHVSSAHPYMR